MIDALLIAINKPTNYSGIFVNYTFSKNGLWQFVEKILKLKYRIGEEQFTKIKERLKDVLEQKARMDLLTLGLSGRPGSTTYYNKERDILNSVYKNYDVKNNILSSIVGLDQKSKEIRWVYMKFFIEYELNMDFSRFKIFYEAIFNKKLESIKDVVNTINKSGISIAEERNNHLSEYPFPFIKENNLISELLSTIEQQIQIKKPDIESFIEKYKDDIIELAGLDYLISSNGVCKKEELRDFLWKISLEAWNRFESYDGVITSKDEEVIGINPVISEKLKEFVINRKKSNC